MPKKNNSEKPAGLAVSEEPPLTSRPKATAEPNGVQATGSGRNIEVAGGFYEDGDPKYFYPPRW